MPCDVRLRNLSERGFANNLAEWHKPRYFTRLVFQNAYAIWPSGALLPFVRYWRHEV